MQQEFRIFIAHAYNPSSEWYNPKNLRSAISSAAAEAARILSVQFSEFSQNVSDGQPLFDAIVQQLNSTHIGLVELSEPRDNVMFEYGFLLGSNRITIPIRHYNASHSKASSELPANIRGTTFLEYRSYEDLEKKLSTALVERTKAERGLFDGDLRKDHVYSIWFPVDTKTIYIVTAEQRPKYSGDSDRNSPNYISLERCCDQDAILHVYAFLSRHYPDAIINILHDGNVHEKMLSEHVVVIGGPGPQLDRVSKIKEGSLNGDQGTPDGNAICRTFSRYLNSRVSYSSDGEEMIIASGGGSRTKKYKHVRESLGTKLDYGYFSSCPNPLDNRRQLVMIHGIHTFGVSGAAHAFGSTTIALRNLEAAYNNAARDQETNRVAFETYFPVHVKESGAPHCPEIGGDGFFELKRTITKRRN